MTDTKTAGAAPRMRFSHLGLVVSDIDMMQDFYTGVLGFELTDKGVTSQGATMAFMTLDPVEHHQVFLVDGKPDALPSNTVIPNAGPVLHHLSFRLDSLTDLRAMHDRLASHSDRHIRAVSHGVCWAIYTSDPEGNELEFFADSPWYIHQPVLKPIDLSRTDDELMAETEEMCRAAPGFKPYAEFYDDLERRVPPRPAVLARPGMTSEITIRGGHAGRIEVAAGDLLEIVNVEGSQICDFFAFARDDIREHLSPAHTRGELLSVALGRGDRLFSVRRRPMFEIVEDTVGRHDMIFPACDPERYRLGFGVADHRSCRANLAEIMADHAIPFEYLPDPINFFQNTPVEAGGSIAYGAASIAEAGDKVVLRALTDAIAVGSACAMDLTGINGERLTDIRMTVRAG